MPAGHRRWTTIARRLKTQGLPCYLHQYGLCKYNGQPIDYQAHHLNPMAFSADHILPTNHGGRDTDANAGPSHRRCNCARHDDPLPALHEPHTETW